jgi:hypothetical protein
MVLWVLHDAIEDAGDEKEAYVGSDESDIHNEIRMHDCLKVDCVFEQS